MSTHPNSALEAQQRWMLEALIAPRRVGGNSVADTLLPGGQLDAAGCLAVYQRSYILRLRKCLMEQFPATCHALGEQLFCDFADDYLRQCPSDSYTLYALGRRFPDWLEATRPDRDQPEEERESWIDFMVDLATYERALFHLFDAPGHEGKPWPDAKTQDSELVLQSGAVLAEYRFPAAWYYHEVRAGKAPQVPPPGFQRVAILRRDYQTTTYPLSPLHYHFLTLLRELGQIDPALEAIAEWAQQPLDTVRASWENDVRNAWIAAGFFVPRSTV